MKEPAHCRSCGAPITWARTAAGRWMPLEYLAEPPVEFELWVIDEGEGSAEWTPAPYTRPQHLIRRGQKPDPASWPRYVPHWSRCPERL